VPKQPKRYVELEIYPHSFYSLEPGQNLKLLE
jgi:hypothetical protein